MGVQRVKVVRDARHMECFKRSFKAECANWPRMDRQHLADAKEFEHHPAKTIKGRSIIEWF